jgi:hypothetical protein
VHDLPSDFSDVPRTLVRLLGDAAAEQKRPLWVQLIDQDQDDFRLAICPDDDPLVGQHAPPECFAVGAVGTGRMRSLDPSHEVPAKFVAGLTSDIRMACVVARTGEVGWHMELCDGCEISDPPEEGRMLDVLRRYMALPTPPPPRPVGRLHAIGWMAGVLERAATTNRRLRWNEVLGIHPAVSGPCAVVEHSPEDVIRRASAEASWESLRLLVATGWQPGGMPDPELARWMDEGMFARWVLASLPELETLIDDVRPVLFPSAARRLAHLAREVA